MPPREAGFDPGTMKFFTVVDGKTREILVDKISDTLFDSLTAFGVKANDMRQTLETFVNLTQAQEEAEQLHQLTFDDFCQEAQNA